MLEGAQAATYEQLHHEGLAANAQRNFIVGAEKFTAAYQLAQQGEDPLEQLHALNPLARAQYGQNNFDAAGTNLATALALAEQTALSDEQAAVLSNMGRMYVVLALTKPPHQHADLIRSTALPLFQRAASLLNRHPHIYYKYENAGHAAIAAATAGQRQQAWEHIGTGAMTAFKKSEAPYDTERRPADINKRGLIRFAAAAVLTIMAGDTPILANYARKKLMR